MRMVIAVALTLTSACHESKSRETVTVAPSASAVSAHAPATPASSVAPPTSALEPEPKAPEPSSTRVCPDAGPPKGSPITLVYTQVFVPSRPGQRKGTSFSVVFRGEAVPVPPASAIYSWCSADKTDDPATFELRCHKRAEPVCTIRVSEQSVAFECGTVKREIEVPCGVRATLKLGRLPGTLSYH
ncbi:MAG: hypothetical protein IT377_16500 [Polyangiaceae bacterium]|nr:hypothetical protein [Polyangiaceae bacterium]